MTRARKLQAAALVVAIAAGGYMLVSRSRGRQPVALSAFVSLTPMICSRFLRQDTGGHGRAYRIVEAGFDAILDFYRRTLDVALRFRFITLMVFLATVATTGVLFVIISKGFFPSQDVGPIIGVSEVRRTPRSTRWRGCDRRSTTSSPKTLRSPRSLPGRRRHRRPAGQRRPLLYQPQAMGPAAERWGDGRHRPVVAEGARHRRRVAVHAAGAGHQLVKIDAGPVAPLAVNHQSQFPAVTISFNLAPGASLGDATTAIDALRSQLSAPVSLQGSFQGSAQAFQSSLSSEPLLIAAALVAVYLILGILYESYILPLTILSTLPSAGLGALLMLAHTDLSVIGIIGVILLIGIVKKNGIMMVDFAISAERRDGISSFEAIRQACLMRFRPILMTTVAALLSGLPLMLESGAGSELRKPLGLAMVGGLLVSQVLTLYTTPVVYLYLDRVQQWITPRRTSRMPALAAKLGQVPAK